MASKNDIVVTNPCFFGLDDESVLRVLVEEEVEVEPGFGDDSGRSLDVDGVVNCEVHAEVKYLSGNREAVNQVVRTCTSCWRMKQGGMVLRKEGSGLQR